MTKPVTVTLPGEPAWLRDFCGHDEGRPAFNRPWSIETPAGKKYTVATNGHRLLALDGDLGYPLIGLGRGGPSMGQADRIIELLSAPSGAPINRLIGVDLTEFRAFLQRYVKVTSSCTVCHGEGSVECDSPGPHLVCCDEDNERSCTACGDDGRSLTKVRIGSGQFNARLFARPIDAISGSHAHWYQVGAETPAMLIGSGWRLIVMPMKSGVGRDSIASFPIGAR